MYICVCKGLTDSAVREIATSSVATAEDLIDAVGWDDGSCCGRCANGIDRIFSLVTADCGHDLVARPLAFLTQ